ncbi:putative hydroxypyruvate isomerase YgbM [Salmonella enterica]|nr:putative hydroxypyruvate isomerase YgbM [Salmonella enterica]
MMFTEVLFIVRFAAAAEAGFQAVEFLCPCGLATSEIKAQVSREDLTLALFNTSAGDTAAGEWGRSALPGREHHARADIVLALEYAPALGCELVHIMAGARCVVASLYL